MKRYFARRLVPACTLLATAAATLAGMVAPGAASAELGPQCSGVNVTGQGASALALAMGVWTPGFNASADKFACDGAQGTKAKPTVTYTNTGSGAGLESWGVKKHAANYAFTNALVGTSEAPNSAQKAEIEANETKLVPSALQTVPVTQFATAIIVHLPANCTATSTSNKGRLVLNNATLEGIWRGTINTWSEITDNGDKLSGAGCVATTPITRVVRVDSSGPAHFLKKYLGLINGASFETEKAATKTWNEVSEGPENTTWPKAAAVKKTAVKGEAAEDQLVSETASSIGFGNMAEIRSGGLFSPPTGGPNKATFWAPIQDKAGETITYADPASNKDVAALGEANCAATEYTNGEVAFPPSSVTEPWNEVTTKTSEKHYTICGLAFVLALKAYSAFPGTELGEATDVENFLSFVVDVAKEAKGNENNGGQTLIKKHDYEPLVGKVLTEAQSGVRGVKGKGGTEF
jgi:ABC-type phosphate transport system substrate-binding protein